VQYLPASKKPDRVHIAQKMSVKLTKFQILAGRQKFSVAITQQLTETSDPIFAAGTAIAWNGA
jgi:hypothetical protein